MWHKISVVEENNILKKTFLQCNKKLTPFYENANNAIRFN